MRRQTIDRGAHGTNNKPCAPHTGTSVHTQDRDVTVDQYTLTGKVGCRVINTSLSTPEKDGTSFGSGKRKLRASSSKLASISPAAKEEFQKPITLSSICNMSNTRGIISAVPGGIN